MHDLQIREIVCVPAAKTGLANKIDDSVEELLQNRDKHDAVQQTRADDGAVLEVVEGKEGYSCAPFLPRAKRDQADDTDDDHRNGARTGPFVCRGRR